jgi:hypothetical protein
MGMHWHRWLWITCGVLAALCMPPALAATAHPQIAHTTFRQPVEAQKVVQSETSIAAPALWSEIVTTAKSGMPASVLAWTGTDPLHSLNLAASATVNGWLAPITTFNEQCFGAPSLGYVDVQNNHILIAWAGIDPLHHLNVATFTV